MIYGYLLKVHPKTPRQSQISLVVAFIWIIMS